MYLEIQIEVLRAKLRKAVDVGERRQITSELENLLAKFAIIAAGQDKSIESMPPY